MLTGLELILSVLPLLISASEHHKKGLRCAKTVASNSSKNEQQLHFYYELHDELALLASTLMSVLRGLSSRSEVPKLGALTEEEHDEVKDVLGSNAQPFGDILERLLKSLDALVSEKSLQLTRSDISLQSSRTMFERLERFREAMDAGEAVTRLRERLRFTQNDQSRRVAMVKIREHNKKLERLVHTSALTSMNVFHRSPPKKLRAERLRRMSEPLYKKIAGKLSTACESHDRHEARLCLWNCCSQQRYERSSDSLDMVVSVTDVEKDGSHWQESVIFIPSANDQRSTKAAVRFIGDDVSSSKSIEAYHGDDVDSESLCNLIQQAHIHGATLQVVFDRGKLWKTRSRRNSLRIEKQKDLTLKDFFDRSESRIALREKRILAVVLAHAALHGSDGPWLCENWSKEHICFFKTGPSMEPDLLRPFLKVSFQDNPITGPDARNLLANSSWEALGILLLEIYLAKAIESEWLDEDLIDGQPNAMTNLTTALRLLEASEGELYEGYRTAIRECLKPDMCCPETEDFRRKVYEKIVLPLEQELLHGFHLSPEDLELAPGTFVKPQGIAVR